MDWLLNGMVERERTSLFTDRISFFLVGHMAKWGDRRWSAEWGLQLVPQQLQR